MRYIVKMLSSNVVQDSSSALGVSVLPAVLPKDLSNAENLLRSSITDPDLAHESETAADY